MDNHDDRPETPEITLADIAAMAQYGAICQELSRITHQGKLKYDDMPPSTRDRIIFLATGAKELDKQMAAHHGSVDKLAADICEILITDMITSQGQK